MNHKKDLFYKHIIVPADDNFIDSSGEVLCDADGYFITIRDSNDGSAMMTLPCAVEIHGALGEAIQLANEKRKTK